MFNALTVLVILNNNLRPNWLEKLLVGSSLCNGTNGSDFLNPGEESCAHFDFSDLFFFVATFGNTFGTLTGKTGIHEEEAVSVKRNSPGHRHKSS